MYFIITDKNDMIKLVIRKDQKVIYRVFYKCSTGFNKFTKLKCGGLVDSNNIFLQPHDCYLRVAISLHTEIPSDELVMNGKIILSDRYYLDDPATIIKFNLKITERYVAHACSLGLVNFLEWWKNYDTTQQYDQHAMNIASRYGHVNVLTWWFNSGLPLKYTSLGLDYASEKGHIEVLEWWLKSNLPLKYSINSINKFNYDNIHVLEWWKNSGLELKYSNTPIDIASANGKLDVLEWWVKSGLELKYDKYSLYEIPNDKLKLMLTWWESNNLDISFEMFSLDGMILDISHK